MKEIEIETAGAGCSASRQLSADPQHIGPAEARRPPETQHVGPAEARRPPETDGASGSWKAIEMGMEMESACWMETEMDCICLLCSA